jgi:Tfp pilus assembly protein PilF
MPDVMVRIPLAIAALAVAVFLALELHSEHRLQRGKAAAFAAGQHALPPDRRAGVLDDLRAGQRLHPGTDALLARALVELRAGNAADAERLARTATKREPRNWEAWRALAATLQGRDDAASRAASQRARSLNPRAP